MAGQNDDIVVRISYPALPVVRPGVYIRVLNDCRAKRTRLLYGSVERAQLEPEQNTKTVRRLACVAKVGMSVNVPGVKLENYFAVPHNLLIFIPAMTALTAEQLLVPTTARFDIAHDDEWLRSHDSRGSIACRGAKD